MDDKRIAELRALRGQGMTSAVGEYTPNELWEALDALERLRRAAKAALAVLDDLDECELARLRGRGDEAARMLLEALGPNAEVRRANGPAA